MHGSQEGVKKLQRVKKKPSKMPDPSASSRDPKDLPA